MALFRTALRTSDYRNSLLRCIFTALFLCASAGKTRAGLEDGIKYYEAGDHITALKELEPFAEQGNVKAQFFVGVIYSSGEDIPKDNIKAVHWWRLAADQGYSLAQGELGRMYLKGEGVTQNYQEALRLLRLASHGGYLLAQHNLAVMYYSGDGVPLNYTEAFRLEEMAANQGLGVAQIMLGIMYMQGHGTPQNYILAHMWINLGHARHGTEESARLRDELATKMTPEQIAEAQHLAREWRQKKNE